MIRCPPGRFDSLANDSKQMGIDNFFWCPKNKEIVLKGDFMSSDFQIIYINVDYCN
jgi:hypothetical protein